MDKRSLKQLDDLTHEVDDDEHDLHESVERSDDYKNMEPDPIRDELEGTNEIGFSLPIGNATSIKESYKQEVEPDFFSQRKSYSWRDMIDQKKNEFEFDISFTSDYMRRNIKIYPLPENLIVNEQFPLHCLPNWAKRFVSEVAESLQVKIEAVAPALLAAMFISGQGNFKIKINNDYREALTAYIVVVIPSGGKKSAIVEKFRRPIDDLEAELQMEYDAMAHSRQVKRELLLDLKKNMKLEWTRKTKGQSLENLDELLEKQAVSILEIDNKIKKCSSRPQILLDGGTLKGLAQVMERQNEFIGILEAEGGIFKSPIRSSENSILLKSYTMEPFGYETKKESVSMKGPCLAIGAYLQRVVVEELYSNEALNRDGLLHRILPVFVHTEDRCNEPYHKEISNESKKRYSDKIRSLFSIRRPEGEDGDRTYYEIELDEGALTEWQKYKFEVSERIINRHFHGYESFGEKLAGHAIRLAGAIHLLKRDDPHKKRIDRHTMAEGIILAEFFEKHARVALDKDLQRGYKYAKAILDWLVNFDRHNSEKPDNAFTQREANRGVSGSNVEDIRAGLDVLAYHGYISIKKIGKSVWCVMHPLHRFNANRY